MFFFGRKKREFFIYTQTSFQHIIPRTRLNCAKESAYRWHLSCALTRWNMLLKVTDLLQLRAFAIWYKIIVYFSILTYAFLFFIPTFQNMLENLHSRMYEKKKKKNLFYIIKYYFIYFTNLFNRYIQHFSSYFYIQSNKII